METAAQSRFPSAAFSKATFCRLINHDDALSDAAFHNHREIGSSNQENPMDAMMLAITLYQNIRLSIAAEGIRSSIQVFKFREIQQTSTMQTIACKHAEPGLSSGTFRAATSQVML
ncbi:hypothetical protein [Delftia acidovorans]|uniref:hypothetical protein n=1 Tax=Delftia acidovorans TaxID=80866 RepID=UPI001C0C2E3F|nr:hypothetical protein [Delftia acidovorans]